MHFREFGWPAKARNLCGRFNRGDPVLTDKMFQSIVVQSVLIRFTWNAFQSNRNWKLHLIRCISESLDDQQKLEIVRRDSNRGDPVLTDKMFQSIVVQSVLIRFTWNAFQSNRNWKLHLIRCISESLEWPAKLKKLWNALSESLGPAKFNRGDPVLTDKMFQSIVVQSVSPVFQIDCSSGGTLFSDKMFQSIVVQSVSPEMHSNRTEIENCIW